MDYVQGKRNCFLSLENHHPNSAFLSHSNISKIVFVIFSSYVLKPPTQLPLDIRLDGRWNELSVVLFVWHPWSVVGFFERAWRNNEKIRHPICLCRRL